MDDISTLKKIKEAETKEAEEIEKASKEAERIIKESMEYEAEKNKNAENEGKIIYEKIINDARNKADSEGDKIKKETLSKISAIKNIDPEMSLKVFEEVISEEFGI